MTASPITIEDVYNLIVNSNKDLKEDIQQINKNHFDVRTELEKTNIKFKEVEKENTLLKNKVLALENKLKKFNIVIYGINDSEKNLADEVKDLIEHKLDVPIDELHKSIKLPKGSGIFISNDFAQEECIKRKTLYAHLKKARSSNNI
nr:unnamed protein product [Callosobruchus analis]